MAENKMGFPGVISPRNKFGVEKLIPQKIS